MERLSVVVFHCISFSFTQIWNLILAIASFLNKEDDYSRKALKQKTFAAYSPHAINDMCSLFLYPPRRSCIAHRRTAPHNELISKEEFPRKSEWLFRLHNCVTQCQRRWLLDWKLLSFANARRRDAPLFIDTANQNSCIFRDEVVENCTDGEDSSKKLAVLRSEYEISNSLTLSSFQKSVKEQF